MDQIPVALPVTATPVTERERIAVIDILRGVAILGIVIVNIQYFAFTLPDSEDWILRNPSLGETVVRMGVSFFAELKFMTFFSLLFGMGLALQSRRAQAARRPFGAMYVRRLLVLLAFGIAHGVLLWYGDILTLYAILGFFALLARHASPRRLLIVATAIFVVPVLLLTGCWAINPDQPFHMSDWSDLADNIAAEIRASKSRHAAPLSAPVAGEPDPAARSISDPNERPMPDEVDNHPAVRLLRFVDDEQRVFQAGSPGEIILLRTFYFFLIGVLEGVMIMGWRCLAMMYVGMSLIGRGVYDDPARHVRLFRWLVIAGLAVGVPLQAIAIGIEWKWPQRSLVSLASFNLLYVGSAGIALVYLGGISLLCLRRGWAQRLEPLAAVGKTALTNYLLQSLLCNLVFYSYGLGLFGRISLASAVGIALLIFVFQAALSWWWVRRFRFGPFEWLWRSLTYMHIQPLRKPALSEAGWPGRHP